MLCVTLNDDHFSICFPLCLRMFWWPYPTRAHTGQKKTGLKSWHNTLCTASGAFFLLDISAVCAFLLLSLKFVFSANTTPLRLHKHTCIDTRAASNAWFLILKRSPKQ